jgi:hypothetical protein
MKTKYKVGDLVKTRRGIHPKISGIVTSVFEPTDNLLLLWDSLEPHYIVKDTKNDVFLSVIERGLERA